MKKLTPLTVTMLVLVIGMGFLVAGVYLLAGMGWALLVVSLPFLASAGVLIRGMTSVRN